MSTSFDGQRAYEQVKHLTLDVGARVMGTAGAKQAADSIRAYFESL